MERDMCKYVDSLSGTSFAILERLVSHQYKKFIHFYRIVESYSDSISKMKYEFRDTSSLCISLVFTSKKELTSIANALQAKMEERGCDGDAKVDKKTIRITIILDEDH